jgi:outer membrane protein OmpA-like peptidoglycan-associated protein
MRSIRILIIAGALALPASQTLAQMYPGQGVIVNPYAGGPPLEPGQPYGAPLQPIHLHMPVDHHYRVVHRRHRTVAAAKPAGKRTDETKTAAQTPAAAAPPAAAPQEQAKAQAPATSDSSTSAVMGAAIPFSFGGQAPAAKPPPQKQATRAAPAAATETASTEAPPAQTPTKSDVPSGFTKRGEILFTKNETDPAPAQFDGLKLLAGDLSTALKDGATRVELEAYGGPHGDKGSAARRLSLKRALSIRQVLIDNGVPSSAIDVRAMGGVDDKGPANRVDVYVRQS